MFIVSWLLAGLKYFDDLIRFVFREGAWSVDRVHQEIIDAALKEVKRDVNDVVQMQLSKRYFFSWMSDGRINTFFFYFPSQIPRIHDPAFEDCLFNVEIWIEKRKYRARVTFYEGRIFSVELPKPRKFFDGKEFLVGAAAPGRPSDSLTGAIDIGEHGKGEHTDL